MVALESYKNCLIFQHFSWVSLNIYIYIYGPEMSKIHVSILDSYKYIRFMDNDQIGSKFYFVITQWKIPHICASTIMLAF